MTDNNIISLGADFRAYDRKFWGRKDHGRAAMQDQLIDLSDAWTVAGQRPFPPDHVMSWQLHGETAADKARKTRLNLAGLEERAGLTERRWY
jgi:hypothetical protein